MKNAVLGVVVVCAALTLTLQLAGFLECQIVASICCNLSALHQVKECPAFMAGSRSA